MHITSLFSLIVVLAGAIASVTWSPHNPVRLHRRRILLVTYLCNCRDPARSLAQNLAPYPCGSPAGAHLSVHLHLAHDIQL